MWLLIVFAWDCKLRAKIDQVVGHTTHVIGKNKQAPALHAHVRARLISLLEIVCEGAPAASAECGSCGELMELSSGLTTGMVIDARRMTHGGRGSAEGGLWEVVAGDWGWLRRVLDLY